MIHEIYALLAGDQLREYDKGFDLKEEKYPALVKMLKNRHPHYNHVASLLRAPINITVGPPPPSELRRWYSSYDNKLGMFMSDGRWLLLQAARRYRAYSHISREECNILIQMIISPDKTNVMIAEEVISNLRTKITENQLNKLKTKNHESKKSLQEKGSNPKGDTIHL